MVATAIVVADMVGVGFFTSWLSVKDIPRLFHSAVWTVGGVCRALRRFFLQ